MSLGPVILLTVIWLAMFKILTCESLHNSGIHRGRHKYKRRHLFSEENNRHVRLHYENLPLEQDASLLMLDEDNEDVSVDASFELDKPLPIDQVAIPVGGKAYLPCDTRYAGQDTSTSVDSAGFFMVMWFKEQKENHSDDPIFEQTGASSSSTAGEPIFTYDTRQLSASIQNPPRWWSSPLGFGDRAYFHTSNSELQKFDQDLVDHLTVDRAMATDTGIYRCRIDFLKAPTRNRLVNLTVIVAPGRPKIYFEQKNTVEGNSPENYQRDSENIVIDEGTPTVTLVCIVNGGWPRPRLTWYNENAVLDSTYSLSGDENENSHGQRKNGRPSVTGMTTVNRLVLTNLTRWHSVMGQRHATTGTARLTCQASNSITTASASNGLSRPTVVAGTRNLPPPATTEHTYIRLNLKPTEVQIVSIRGKSENHSKTEGNHIFDKNEVVVTEDATGHKKYMIRANRMYRAECQSKGSRPLATIEWYLLKKNQRYAVGQSANGSSDTSSSMIRLEEKRGSMSKVSDGTLTIVVETLQTPVTVTDKDETVVTTSILHFKLQEPTSVVIDANDDNESTLVCRAYNPAIKTIDHHYIETKITLDVHYPPIVHLQFGNRMLDTGSIGPGEDVYFECAARANPSSTIRYSWYHNGVRLMQETEKRRTDDGEKRGEKKNNRLASRVIQYSQLGSLVLQSVKAAAAGRYTCQATNGINYDSNDNKMMSNSVRLFVKHVPVCRHREDVVIVMKKSDPVTGPVIRCRAGHGHPPANQYNWRFYPEQAEPERRHSGPSPDGSDGMMAYAGRSTRGLGSLLAETAVPDGGGGTSYAFTTNTPVLKSYASNVAAAAAASSASSASGVATSPKFLHGRLECRAVNSMGVQTKPCVYRITDKMLIGQGHREIADCRPMSRKELPNETVNSSDLYPCGIKVEDMVTNTNRKIRFCIACTLNESSSHYHNQRFSYILQLLKNLPGKAPSSVIIAFNITGVTITDNSGNNKTNSNEQDEDDYYSYFDPEEEDMKYGERGDYSQEIKNVVQRVVFVIDDSVEPGMYRGRIYNSNEGIISSIVKGMINVAAATMNDINVNDDSDNYIIDEIEDNNTDESILGYAWHRVTIALVEMFSVVVPPPPPPPPPHYQEFDGADRRRQPHRQWQAASAALTAVLVAVVIALSCGICAVVALLYRRQYYNRRTDRGHVYGLGRNEADDADGRTDDDVSGAAGKLVAGHRRKTPEPAGTQAQQEQPPQSSASRSYAVNGAANNNNSNNINNNVDDDHDGASETQVSPTHQRQHQKCAEQLRKCRPPTADVRVVVNKSTPRPAVMSIHRDDGAGPDIVMSTTYTAIATDILDSTWQQQQQPLQPQQMKFNTINSNHQWSSYQFQYQKPNSTIVIPKSTFPPTNTPATAEVLTSKHSSSRTINPAIGEPLLPVPSRVLLNALHRESSI
ncbi:uncharacterized protein LOC112686242 [Sipha flava]|uniref:Uncharacterized protein LOC112686242 n=1 Tax=Sipha flava TaxID=143950 RepID=A0A8B8FUR9_9HEMI|nr:uncharacterized protein LOC112686242 [Sipha flava]XP_025414234.1 uncharacterized protein LOC112686242 [Sipha flava]